MKINRSHYVAQLPEDTQQRIRAEIELIINTLNLSIEEKKIAIQEAMDSKLCDLSDLINIDKYKR